MSITDTIADGLSNAFLMTWQVWWALVLGFAYTIRIVALMLVAIVIATLLVDAIFTGLGLVPHIRPTRTDIFSGVKVAYKLITNAFGVVVFAVLFALATSKDSEHVATPMHHSPGSLPTPLADPGAGG